MIKVKYMGDWTTGKRRLAGRSGKTECGKAISMGVSTNNGDHEEHITWWVQITDSGSQIALYNHETLLKSESKGKKAAEEALWMFTGSLSELIKWTIANKLDLSFRGITQPVQPFLL